MYSAHSATCYTDRQTAHDSADLVSWCDHCPGTQMPMREASSGEPLTTVHRNVLGQRKAKDTAAPEHELRKQSKKKETRPSAWAARRRGLRDPWKASSGNGRQCTVTITPTQALHTMPAHRVCAILSTRTAASSEFVIAPCSLSFSPARLTQSLCLDNKLDCSRCTHSRLMLVVLSQTHTHT